MLFFFYLGLLSRTDTDDSNDSSGEKSQSTKKCISISSVNAIKPVSFGQEKSP